MIYKPGPSGIHRLTKHMNRHHKKQNHLANVRTRAMMNSSADGSEGRNPRPGVINGSAAPYSPKAAYKRAQELGLLHAEPVKQETLAEQIEAQQDELLAGNYK